MSTEVLEDQTSKNIQEGKDAIRILQTTVPSFRKALPKYQQYTGPAILEDFLGELEHYKAFYDGLPDFLKEKKKTYSETLDYSPAGALRAFATAKGIRKFWHPNHIPKTNFDEDIQIAIVQVFNLYLNALTEFVNLYKEALKFGSDDWSVNYKIQLGEKVSQYLALFSSELPCMEGQADDLTHLVSSYRTRRQEKPGFRTRMTQSASRFFTRKWAAVKQRMTRRRGTVAPAAPASFRFKTRGAFNDHIAKMSDKYEVLNLLMNTFRLALCEGEESCKADKPLSQYYTYEKFKEFIQFLASQKQLDTDLTKPFHQEGYVEDLLKELYAVDSMDELFDPKEMPDEKICCDVNQAIVAIKVKGGKRRRRTRRCRNQAKR